MRVPSRGLVTIILGGLIVVLIAAELGLRTYLGTPPLSVTDDEIEYMFKPNQHVRRFGNRVDINAYGMRSGALRESETFRIVVFGDSVVNGGNLTDQARLATSIVSALRTKGSEPVEALNVSAGSWGPGNMLAYVERFGLFDSDAGVLILSSHDLNDNRTFTPLDPSTHPMEAPTFALVEFVNRYLQRFSPVKWQIPPALLPGRPNDGRTTLPVLMDRLGSLPNGACLILHYTKEELDRTAPPAFDEMRAMAEARGIATIADRDFMNEGSYRDNIHVNEYGQQGLVQAMRACPNLANVNWDADGR